MRKISEGARSEDVECILESFGVAFLVVMDDGRLKGKGRGLIADVEVWFRLMEPMMTHFYF